MTSSRIAEKVLRLKRSFLGACALRAPGLAALLPAPVPLHIAKYETPGRRDRKQLLILLPGIGDTAACYERHGFISIAKQCPAGPDVWAVDAHIGYYARRTILERLHQDVMIPARAAGYRSISLAGISLGGFGALLYASTYPGIERIIAVAPFLGRPAVVEEIAVSGLAQWAPSVMAAGDYERRLWSWLKGYASGAASPLPQLYLAFGNGDGFAPAHQLLSGVLPSGHVFMAPGGHTWSTWRQLWAELHAEDHLYGSRPDTDTRILRS